MRFSRSALRFPWFLTLAVTAAGLGCKKPASTTAQADASVASRAVASSPSAVASIESPTPSSLASAIPSASSSGTTASSANGSKTAPSASASAKKSSSTIPVCGAGASLFVNDANKTVCSQHCDSDKDCKGGMKCSGSMGVPADPKTGDPLHPGNAGITPICSAK